jgi:hypothetical protein
MAGGQRHISWLHPYSTSNVALNTRTSTHGPLMGHSLAIQIGPGVTRARSRRLIVPVELCSDEWGGGGRLLLLVVATVVLKLHQPSAACAKWSWSARPAATRCGGVGVHAARDNWVVWHRLTWWWRVAAQRPRWGAASRRGEMQGGEEKIMVKRK